MADFGDGGQQFCDGANGWLNGAADVISGGAGYLYNSAIDDNAGIVRNGAQYGHGQFVAGSGKANMYDGIGKMGNAIGEGASEAYGAVANGVSSFGRDVWNGITSLGANRCDTAAGAGGAGSAGCGPAPPPLQPGGVPDALFEY